MSCYVPFCDSSQFKKRERLKDVSFHQFPTDVEIKKKWIIAIGKKDPKTGAYWEPHSSAAVCSLHFSPKQFNVTATSKKVLKHGSIPYIFLDYYLPEQGTLISEEDLSSMKLIPSPFSANAENASQPSKSTSKKAQEGNTNVTKKIKKKKRTFNEMNTSETDTDNVMDKQPSKGISKPKYKVFVVNCKQKQLLTKVQNNGSVTFEFVPTADSNAKDSSSSVGSSQCVNESSAILNSNGTFSKNPFGGNLELAKKCKVLSNAFDSEKAKNVTLSSEVSKLQAENKILKLKNGILEQKLELLNITELQRGIVNSDAKALFLFDQLCSLTQKECNWSEITMNFAKNLQTQFPTCYNFLKQGNVITLPASINSGTSNTNAE